MKEIMLYIHDESDLYSPFDPGLISSDVVSFIEERIKETENFFSINIMSSVPVNMERLKQTFDTYVSEQEKALGLDQRRNTFRQIRLFVIGIAFILLWIFVSSRTDGVVPEVLSIIGSFAIWEATNIWLVDNPDIRVKRLFLNQYEKIKIIVTYPEGDNA